MALEKEKNVLLEICTTLVEQRMQAAEKAMKEAQDSSNGEEKSSAGDKYETARAMGQINRNLNARQLLEARKELESLQWIAQQKSSSKIQKGALIETDGPWFFIAIGLGKVDWAGKEVYVINPEAPLAATFESLTQGNQITFKDNSFIILNVG